MKKGIKRRRGGFLLRLVIGLAGLGVLLVTGLFSYLLVMEQICKIQPELPLKAMIVLGAQVNPDGQASVQLEWRLNAALQAYQKQKMPMVLCGGQGKDEKEPESVTMARWMIQRGVSPEEIKQDPISQNTKENIANSKLLLPEGDEAVLIVTSDYHLPRAIQLAKDAGLKPIGLGSPIKPEYWFKNHFRETLAWGKYLLQRFIPIP